MTTQSPILYLGDTDLNDAAAYLAGVMQHAGWEFDYLSSHLSVAKEHVETRRALYVLSDYPAKNFPPELQQQVVTHLQAGSGLLMCGGWESFHGLGGDWNHLQPLAELLPVDIATVDDRVNCDHPVLVRRSQHRLNQQPAAAQPNETHPILANLPWDERPPIIGGFNRFTAKQNATVLLEAEHFQVQRHPETSQFSFTTNGVDPLLVVDTIGNGRVAALATDVAPHWVGPLVDWGDDRVSAQAPQANDIEVGNLYAQFLQQLLGWVADEKL